MQKAGIFAAGATLALVTAIAHAAPTWTAFNDHVAGRNVGPIDVTGQYVTIFNPDGLNVDGAAASGVLLDSATGASTGVTLTTSVANASGSPFTHIVNPPNVGTDSYNIFLGQVSMGPTTSTPGPQLRTSIELNNANHTFTHAYSGLSPDFVYDFVGTATRGEATYTDRWSLITLVGAVSATPAHSTGALEVSPTSVAINTGDNVAGLVARWSDIDPGPDGQFSIVTSWYTPKGGTKGYGLTATRLQASPIPEPTSLAALALGGMALLRRRSR